jgi:hypothetical protein
VFQKAALQSYALAKAYQTAIRTDHPMTGHDKEKRITVASHSYGPCASRRTYGTCHLAIG